MKLRKIKICSLFLVFILLLGVLGGCTSDSSNISDEENNTNEIDGSQTTKFPTKDFQGTIMWSAGGISDTVSRAIGPFVQEELKGSNIIFTNRPGAAGGISTQYVNEQPADGYNLLFGAENPQVAKVMGTSTLDYSDFIPINIFSTTVGVVLVRPDSKYKTIEDLVDDMLARPGEVTMGATGPGGLPQTVGSMMRNVSGTEAQYVDFDGEAGALTAVLGGHVDYTITTLGSANEMLRSGKLVGLAVFHTESIEGIEDVPVILDTYPEYGKFLPWGPFYGVFVKNGTPQEIVDILTEAFDKAVSNPEYAELTKNLGSVPLGIKGQEARDFVDNYRSITSWLLYEAGATEKSPEEFGIKRID